MPAYYCTWINILTYGVWFRIKNQVIFMHCWVPQLAAVIKDGHVVGQVLERCKRIPNGEKKAGLRMQAGELSTAQKANAQVQEEGIPTV